MFWVLLTNPELNLWNAFRWAGKPARQDRPKMQQSGKMQMEADTLFDGLGLRRIGFLHKSLQGRFQLFRTGPLRDHMLHSEKLA
ncbi:MAG: hypothetical protein JWM08_2994 [Candidatus Angelobacter sp.]|nr:hypothetical protein [Candidatus Angelobacter sp.]MCU1334002.1 hypothetical protein [Candidatus Angelobacter sp.]